MAAAYGIIAADYFLMPGLAMGDAHLRWHRLNIIGNYAVFDYIICASIIFCFHSAARDTGGYGIGLWRHYARHEGFRHFFVISAATSIFLFHAKS